MIEPDRIRLYQHHIAEAQAEQAKAQSQLANSVIPPDDPQVMAWRNRLAYWERMEREYRARLERLLRDGD